MIPIVIGVAGHRDIRKSDREVLKATVSREIRGIREKCPNSGIVMLNNLAAGADILMAEVAESLSIPVIAALPMEQALYEQDFDSESLEQFRYHLAKAKQSFVAPFTEETSILEERDYAYRQAGIYIAKHSHVLLALWDGKESTSGCGTAEDVQFALRGSYRAATVSLQSEGFVIHVQTPRQGDDPASIAGEVRFLGEQAALDQILSRTDEFNRLALRNTKTTEARILPESVTDQTLARMETVYGAADTLSLRSAKRHRRILACLAVISTVIAVSFLLYDEAAMYWLILVCGIMLLAAWITQKIGKRTASHRRYLDYRVLAENLRVEAFLRFSGSQVLASDVLPWSEREGTPWIVAALNALEIAEPQSECHSVRDCWVEEQRKYQLRAYEKAQRSFRLSERTVKTALAVNIVLYVSVLAFELLFGGLLPTPWKLPDPEIFRVISKLILGSVSAMTIFVVNYYGKLSLPRSIDDYIKMERFYAAVLDKLELSGQTEELLKLLAREELAQTADWYSYQRENGAEINL